ncbi:DeoR/GlpR family DNA-binding transcription regulator [Nocardioides sp. LHG3406-4]|uniref:DeoR/GlpR family DNA-binding transcription regulator n=1 Tax=Nocardioides sp. LHG3406-4 TaxID=2804575 RepID=UPI003CF65373
MKNLRHDRILDILQSEGRVEVSELSRQLDVSEMTTRRDLLELESLGSLRRVRGGAVRELGRSFEPGYRTRQHHALVNKKAIAAAAAELVADGDAIALDVGSTVLHMVDQLVGRSGLSIVTSNLRVAWAVANNHALERSVRLILAGGVVRPDELNMTGSSAQEHYRRLRVDTAFIGVGGVNATAGLTDYNLEDAELKRVLVDSARRVIVLADSSKLGHETFAHVADLGQVDALVTDAMADAEAVEELRGTGLHVVLAPVPAA